MIWRKANSQRLSGRRKYECVAYLPLQKWLAETACLPGSQRSNYSPAMPGRKPTLKAFIWSPTNCEDITRWGMKYRGHEIKLGDFQYGWSLEMLQLYDLLGAMNNITLAVQIGRASCRERG